MIKTWDMGLAIRGSSINKLLHNNLVQLVHTHLSNTPKVTRSPATAGKANRPLLFLEHRIPMPELFTELRFSVLQEFWTQEIRLPLLGGDAPRLG